MSVEEGRVTMERKLVTILFADLVGSTAFASEEDPERVRSFLDSFYGAMAKEAETAGGTVEKFAGDAVLAAFGAWTAQEDHAERALHAALAMQSRFAELFDSRHSIRIGVNTGEVAVGPARVGGAFISGDAVNVAARLEQAAAPGEILVAERTVAAVRGAFEFSEPEVISAKGKVEGIGCRRLLRALSLQRTRGVSGLHKAFVGRQNELDLLRAIFRRAVAQEEPHLVTIVGEPGVGKTRLVRELWDVLTEEDPAPVRRAGRCLAYGDGITYWPFGEILREHLGILDGDPPEEVARRLEGREILGLALGLDVASGLHPLEARGRLHAAAVGFIEELARERPAVALIEDIHWAEDDLLDLLERIAQEARAPVVLLATARPELLDRRTAWSGGRRNATTIWLEPLRPAETAMLVDELLAVEVPDQLRDLLVGRAEGNPFFLEELLGDLVDTGVLERREGAWAVGDLADDFSIPDSVHAVLSARLDRLPAREKAALQAASVVGRVFWVGPVVRLLGGQEPDLALLEARGFVRTREGSSMAGERELAFKHAVTREVAYASIPKARRGRLHAAVADWLDESERARGEHAPLLAYHLFEAVRPEDADLVWGEEHGELARMRARAVSSLRRAGELARGRYEMQEAIELLTRAAELQADDRERALLWREVGHAQALWYDGEAFFEAMSRALEGRLAPRERAETYGLLALQTSIRPGMFRVRPRPAQIEEWVEQALELGSGDDVVRAQALLARANVRPDEVPDAVLAEMSDAAERSGDPNLRSYALGARSHAAFDRLQFADAAAWSERRLALVPKLDDPDTVCETYESAVPVAAALGRFAEAKGLVELHWEVARRLSPHHRVHTVSLELELADARGEWRALAEETDRTFDAVAANSATPCLRNARDLLLCAVAYACLGDEESARRLEREAGLFVGEGHDRELSLPRLRLALVRGDSERARNLMRLPLRRTFVWGPAVFATRLDALVALREREWIEREAPRLAVPATFVEPFALRALGAVRRDDELLSKADERFAALGLEWHRSQSERLLEGL